MVQKIEIRNPVTELEVEEAKKVEQAVWGFIYGDDADAIVAKAIHNFRSGFLTAFVDGEGAANFFTIQIKYDMENPPVRWEDVTDNGEGGNYCPTGETLYGSSLGVHPKYRGLGLGEKIVRAAQEKCVELGCTRMVLGCRIPDYHKYANIPVEEYILLKREDGQFLDRELRFYARCGFHFTKPLPEYMSGESADPDSLNYGVQAVWDNPEVMK